MRRAALLLAAMCAMGVTVGCELLVGIKDKTQSTDAAPGPDASPSDATTGDALAGDASAVDPDLPCDKQPTNLFCDDFDSELEAGDGWTWDIAMSGGAVAFDGTEYVSSPRSALFSIPNAPADAQLGQDIGADLQTGYRLAFDLRVDMTDLSSLPQVAAAQVNRAGNDALTVAYVLGSGSHAYIQLYEGSATTPTNLPLSQLPPLQVWTRIVLVYDIQQGLTVIEDGVTILTNPAAAHGAPGQTSIIVGAVYSNAPGSGAATFEIDNVVLQGQ
ncbi:MAG TPA: hypothetical protein VGL81_11705 [Polyangiaceae bacterium]|jgi:hypothetical protein